MVISKETREIRRGKPYIITAMLPLLLIVLLSCGSLDNTGNADDSNLSYNPLIDEDTVLIPFADSNGKYGYMDVEGNVLIYSRNH